MSARKPLTEKQQRIYDLFAEHVRAHGFAPTHREAAVALGMRNHNAIRDQLVLMQKKGYLRVDPLRSRGVRLTGDAPEPCASAGVAVRCPNEGAGDSEGEHTRGTLHLIDAAGRAAATALVAMLPPCPCGAALVIDEARR